MRVPGTGTVAAKDAPIVPGMKGADFGAHSRQAGFDRPQGEPR